jgi:hypothetical protein
MSALAVVLTIAVPAGALAHSPEDEAACTPDVFRLCQQFIPDEKRIVVCLTESKRQLSPACLAVFNRPPSTPAQNAAAEQSAQNVRPASPRSHAPD